MIIRSEWGIFIREYCDPVVYDSNVEPRCLRVSIPNYGIIFSVNSGKHLCTNCWDKELPIGDDYETL